MPKASPQHSGTRRPILRVERACRVASRTKASGTSAADPPPDDPGQDRTISPLHEKSDPAGERPSARTERTEHEQACRLALQMSGNYQSLDNLTPGDNYYGRRPPYCDGRGSRARDPRLPNMHRPQAGLLSNSKPSRKLSGRGVRHRDGVSVRHKLERAVQNDRLDPGTAAWVRNVHSIFA